MSRESRGTDTRVGRHTGPAASASLLTEGSADGAISHIAWLAGTQMSPDGVGADGVLITQILAAGALVMLGARVLVHSGEAW